MSTNKNIVPSLENALHEIHSVIWNRFIDQNNIMLDYTTSDGAISLPTPLECEENQPNALGWWSPIENAGFFTGDYALGLLTAYRLAIKNGKYEEARKRKIEIRRLVQGLLLIQDVCETDGCISRGVASDGYSHYPGSSDDQISPWLLALDAYLESGIPSENEAAVCRAHLLRQLNGLYANRWTVPGDRPGFERSSYINREGIFEAWLGAVHLLTASHIYEKVAPEKHGLFLKYWEGPFFEGLSLKELLKQGFPSSHENSAWYLTHSCYALRIFQERPETEVREICRKSLLNIAERYLGQLPRWRDYLPDQRFDPDWRKMLRAWKPHNSCAEAASLACGEMGSLWHWKISPAIGMEKKTILDSCAAMWLILIARKEDLMDRAIEELRSAASVIPWSKLHYAGLFFAENAFWEWMQYCDLKTSKEL